MITTKPTITNRLNPFDFDYWSQLAKNEPAKFEGRRRAAINQTIASSPFYLKKRLQGLQWRIDMEIRRSKNPMDSCLRLNRMMLDTVYAGEGLIQSVRKLADATPQNRAVEAIVIPFRRSSGN